MKDEAKLANARRSELTDKLTEASEAKKAADEALAQARSAPSMVSVPSSVREAQLQSELEKCMVCDDYCSCTFADLTETCHISPFSSAPHVVSVCEAPSLPNACTVRLHFAHSTRLHF